MVVPNVVTEIFHAKDGLALAHAFQQHLKQQRADSMIFTIDEMVGRLSSVAYNQAMIAAFICTAAVVASLSQVASALFRGKDIWFIVPDNASASELPGYLMAFPQVRIEPGTGIGLVHAAKNLATLVSIRNIAIRPQSIREIGDMIEASAVNVVVPTRSRPFGCNVAAVFDRARNVAVAPRRVAQTRSVRVRQLLIVKTREQLP